MSSKKRKRPVSTDSSVEHTSLKDTVLKQSLRKALPQISEDEIGWLLSTREAHAFITEPNPNKSELNNLIEQLISFHHVAQERHTNLLECVKERLVELESDPSQDVWVPRNVSIAIPPNVLLPPNLGMELGVTTKPSPDGLLVKGFVKNPTGLSGPAETSAVIEVGDIIISFRPGTGSGSNAVRTAMNMFVNLSVLQMFAANVTSGTALSALPVPAEVELNILRLDEKSVQARQTTKNHALSPERISFVSSSPLVTSYSRATHPKRGDDTLWLLNRDSVVNTIVAPLERQKELDALFNKKNIALHGDRGVLNPLWTSSLPKMYDLFTIPELVQKYVNFGEVGRGRNRTSLKTSKQVVNVVTAELKKSGLC
jgi:hypothetical protein